MDRPPTTPPMYDTHLLRHPPPTPPTTPVPKAWRNTLWCVAMCECCVHQLIRNGHAEPVAVRLGLGTRRSIRRFSSISSPLTPPPPNDAKIDTPAISVCSCASRRGHSTTRI
ncbi:hypothetical protein XA68_17588 [Ophiocordyceps unilateralis]|uniref:Uncharacterized protein n=1 Tax=Ophiocordyceps unilateralis TaxID=268505 RepID=A0A2A9PIY2_OPHUN|nr:hypothetical protein XA68_17588 [Ophiocordyceps unilateralis]